nr:Chain B, SER-ALA-ILE-ARG-GLY-ALA [synthetic construct]
SAIRGA